MWRRRGRHTKLRHLFASKRHWMACLQFPPKGIERITVIRWRVRVRSIFSRISKKCYRYNKAMTIDDNFSHFDARSKCCRRFLWYRNGDGKNASNLNLCSTKTIETKTIWADLPCVTKIEEKKKTTTQTQSTLNIVQCNWRIMFRLQSILNLFDRTHVVMISHAAQTAHKHMYFVAHLCQFTFSKLKSTTNKTVEKWWWRRWRWWHMTMSMPLNSFVRLPTSNKKQCIY